MDSDPEFGYLDLSGLRYLTEFDIEIHDVNAICEALLSCGDDLRLQRVRIHTPQWSGLQSQYDTKVSCDRQLLWSRLGRVLCKPQFAQTRMDVRVPYEAYGDRDLQTVREGLAECITKGLVRLRDLVVRRPSWCKDIVWD